MIYLKKYLYISCLVLIFQAIIFLQNTYGQDIHFSQTATSPLNLNPAETGVFQGQYRFTANHRNQWFTVSSPFTTFSLGFDCPLYNNKRNSYIVAAGLVLNADIAGSSRYTETHALASVSFIKALDRKRTNFLSLGIQGGIGQHSMDYDKLSFDNQFDGKQYDPDLASNESFLSPSTYPDIATGVYWLYQPKRDLIYNAGVSISHINQPSLSYFDDKESVINRKYMGYFRMQFEIGKSTEMLPAIYYQQQFKYQEILLGTTFRLVQNYRKQNYSAINLGLYFRGKDALIALVGLDWKSFNFGLSYDMNISSLKPASKSVGAYELSVIYISNKNKKPKPTKIPCSFF